MVPGPRTEERTGAAFGPATVRISGGNAVPAKTKKTQKPRSSQQVKTSMMMILKMSVYSGLLSIVDYKTFAVQP